MKHRFVLMRRLLDDDDLLKLLLDKLPVKIT